MSDRIAFTAPVVAEGRRLRGSVKLAGERTRRNGEWLEIDPEAIKAADQSDIVGRWEHDPARVLGRSSNGTVRFSADDEGLAFEIDLPDTSYANDLLELAKRGDIRGSSFEIEGLKYAFSTDLEDGSRVRRITSIQRITDVSAVTDPAFFASSLAAFSKESNVSENTPAPAPDDPQPEPRATFTEQPKSGKAEWAAFAKDLSTEQIEATMDQVFAAAKGDLRGELLDRYEGFAEELQRRKRESAETTARAERMEALHNLRLGRVPKAPENGVLESDDYRHAFSRYIRGEAYALEQFAQSITGTGAEGGYTVPVGFRQKITETQAAFGGIQALAEVLETSDGRTLPWPSNNDTANSAVVASEGSAPGSAGADIVFGEVSLGAFSIAASGASNDPLKVSWELLQDSAFDIEAFVARKLGERLGRKAAAYYATGVGTTEPFGALAKTPDTMTATKVRAASVEHIFQVNEAYRNSGNCAWVMSDTILSRVWNSVDLNGRPLFIPSESPADGFAGRIAGYPVRTDQGAGTLVAFGDLNQGYIIRRVRDIQVVVDPYNNTATRQTAYHAWMRTDANVQDAAAYSVSDWTSVTADATA